VQPQTKRVEIQEEDALDIFSENYTPPPEQNVTSSNGHKKTSSVASFDLDNTGHYRKGGGVLASRRDIGMNDEEFAAGCKLLLAAARGDIDMVRRLLSTDNKITVDFRDYDRRTALHVAASEGHLPMVKYLVEELKCTISRSDRWGGSPLDDAHRHRHAEIVQYLRSRGAIPGTTDMTVALITAAADGDLDEVQLLVEHGGVNVNAADYDLRTAVHLAAGNNQLSVLTYLLQAGADPNPLDRWGNRPLDEAIRINSEPLKALLLQFNAKIGTSAPSSRHLSEIDASLISTTVMQQDPDFAIDFSELEILDRIGDGAFGAIYKSKWRGTLVAAKCIKSAKIAQDWLKRAQDYQMLATTRHGSKVVPKKTKIGRRPSGDNSGKEIEEDSGRLPSQIIADRKKEMSVATAESAQNSAMVEALEDFRTEVSIMKKLRHPNICLLLAYAYTDEYQVMVSELMKCSLYDVFKANALHNTPLTQRKQIVYALQIAQGMSYLHGFKPVIIHRDLKPQNILISYSGRCKIADFGLAKIRATPAGQGETDQYKLTGETGTYRYMAPEVFRHETYSEKVDTYSFAMLMYFLTAGHAPWPMLNGLIAAQAAAIRSERPTIPRSWDSCWSDLIQQCWDENPSNRPGFDVIILKLEQYSHDVLNTEYDTVAVADVDKNRCRCTIS